MEIDGAIFLIEGCGVMRSTIFIFFKVNYMKYDDALKIVEELLTESSVKRTKFYLENFECATISAFRSERYDDNGKKLDRYETLKKNREESSKLGNDLTSLGYTHFLVDGAWGKYNEDGTKKIDEKGNQIFGKEVTYFVVDNNGDTLEKFRKNIKELGNRYDQDSVMFYPKGDKKKRAFWVGTTDRKNVDLLKGQKQLLNNGRWEPQTNRTTLRGRKDSGYSYDLTNVKTKTL